MSVQVTPLQDRYRETRGLDIVHILGEKGSQKLLLEPDLQLCTVSKYPQVLTFERIVQPCHTGTVRVDSRKVALVVGPYTKTADQVWF